MYYDDALPREPTWAKPPALASSSTPLKSKLPFIQSLRSHPRHGRDRLVHKRPFRACTARLSEGSWYPILLMASTDRRAA